MPLRRGFTMIELLVVVSVIAVLAGILIPTVSMVRRLANDVKCGNNLQQIAGAMVVYRHDNDDAFPPSALGMTLSSGLLPNLRKIFFCPEDRGLPPGSVNSMGRPASYPTTSWGDLAYIYEGGSLIGAPTGSSYDYEMSSIPMHSSELNFFYKDYDEAPTKPKPALNSPEATWAAGKTHQRFFGNLSGTSSSVHGAPFPTSLFPIMRCYWHYKWTGNNVVEDNQKKIKNVSWDLNVFNSTPYWEHDVNPNIPIH
ncbi:MAG: type II secretion system protein [Planctomycetes bacterium]|nr:type II secretion system protein [Planctomycetota bacterium]